MIRHRRYLALLTAIFLAPLSGCEIYPRYGEVQVHDRDYDARVVFGERDRALIREYYESRYRGLPPGLAKKGKVPPGHAMKMNRGAPISHDINWHPIPRDLENRLSRLPDGYARISVGADIGLMNVHTRVVVDLLEDIAD